MYLIGAIYHEAFMASAVWLLGSQIFIKRNIQIIWIMSNIQTKTWNLHRSEPDYKPSKHVLQRF